MRILICGSRGWKDEQPIEAVLLGYKALAETFTLIHGHAKDGADAIADRMAFKHDIHTVRVPANWDRFGKAAGPIRNQKMLDEQKPQVVIAFRARGKSNGTDDMISRAKKAGVPTYVFTEAEDARTEKEEGLGTLFPG